MNTFRTTFDIAPPNLRIDHGRSLFMIGSCFAENIAERLRATKFRVLSNPAGVVYNPLSVAAVLDAVWSGRVIEESELEQEPGSGVWSSFLFHGSFSHLDRSVAAAQMNSALTGARDALAKADTVIITLGTSWVYELADGGGVVANCHKFPVAHFERRRLTVEQTRGALSGLMDTILAGKNVILTVSPIRHLKDGAQGNSASKASLLLAAAELSERYDNVAYFPAFELLCDDLRDYRFYAEDMVHPSDVAVGYIWDKFCRWSMAEQTIELAAEIERVNRALNHRPFNCGSEAHTKFMESVKVTIQRLAARYESLDFDAELKRLDKR